MRTNTIAQCVRHWLGWVPNVLVFAVLSGIGYWGYVFHWTIPQFSELVNAEETHNREVVPPMETEPSPTLPLHNRKSAETGEDESCRPCGLPPPRPSPRPALNWPAAEFMPMDEFVVANGVVSYDRTRLAELSVRVPGRVWRVEKHMRRSGPQRRCAGHRRVRRGRPGEGRFCGSLGPPQAGGADRGAAHRSPGRGHVRALHEAKGKCELARVRRFNAMQTLANLGLPIKLDEFEGLTEEEAARKLHFLGLPGSLVKSLDSRNLLGEPDSADRAL